LCNPEPGGIAVPSSQILIEPRHLRSDESRSGDMYVVAGGYHAKDTAMDIMISSSLSQSCLQQSSTSSNYALRKAKNTKFTKDLRNNEPI
jgi:lysine/ornithine N-monooxygenase